MNKKASKGTSGLSRLMIIILALVFVLLNVNSSIAITQTYVISQSQLVNCGSTCGSNSFYNGCGTTPAGFHWTDVLGSGVTITSISIQFSVGVECASGTRTTSLNGHTEGTFTDNDYCFCSGTGNSLFTINPTNGDYVIGGNNTFLVTNPTSCFGYSLDGGMGGYAVVTVNYVSAPTISSYSTNTACVRNLIVIHGTSLISVNSVTFSNNVAATIIGTTGTTVTVEVPDGAVTGPITVTNPNGSVTGPSFTVNGTAPQITCPIDQVLECDQNICGAEASFSGSYSEGSVSYVFNSNVITSPYTFPTGENHVFMVDSNGTCVAICEFLITVNDVTPPEFTYCPANIYSNCPQNFTFTTPTATDICGGHITSVATFYYT